MKRYFDYAASAPPFPEAVKKWHETATEYFGNPSAVHEEGRRVATLLNRCRSEFCSIAGSDHADRLVFTSSGTEANNMVIRSAMDADPKNRIAVAADSHASVWFARETHPDRVDVIDIESNGMLSLPSLERALTRRTVLCCVLHANNETGVMHDLQAISTVCIRKGVALLVDGVQTIGHLPLPLRALPFDFFTFSAHKFGGLRGTGGVFYRRTDLHPLLHGGPQESGLRGGTEDVASIAASVAALKASTDSSQAELTRLRAMASRVQESLARRIPGALFNSVPASGLPGIVSVSIDGVIGKNLVTDLSLQGFCVSAGSACHSGEMSPSRIILSMGRPPKTALGTIRISMGRLTSDSDVDALTEAVAGAVERQRRHGI